MNYIILNLFNHIGVLSEDQTLGYSSLVYVSARRSYSILLWVIHFSLTIFILTRL